MTGRLSGKVAVITGGSSGIGAATVRLFLDEGAKVVIGDLNCEGHDASISTGAARFIRTDVNDEGDVAAMVALAEEEFGGLDILFNNAGAVGTTASFAEMKAADWDAVFTLLPRAAMLGIKHASALLKKRGGGCIINTASIAAHRPEIGRCAYSAAKATVVALTKFAARELAPDNIRVNSISPGLMPTPIMGGGFVAPERLDDLLSAVAAVFTGAQPLPRGGHPRDIAHAALFFASDESSFVTGQDLAVDGGMLLMGPQAISNIRSGLSEIAERFQLEAAPGK